MKRTVACLAVLALVALGGQAVAEQCTIDAVPAATLLLPYFKVDFTTADPTKAITTFFSINNASAAPALAHVTLWTNLSLPTLDFDIYLTGYDVQVIDLRSIFRDGNLPVTATDAQDDADDTISPHGKAPYGPNPNWDDVGANADHPATNINEASCATFFPFTNPALNSTLIARIQNGHTGQPITSDQCLGLDVGKTTTVDGVEVPLAIGYATIDNVNSCSIIFPGFSATYFVNGGQGIANNRNQLWGDYFIIDPANEAAFGDTLVHIEAFDPVGGTPGEAVVPDQNPAFDFTFYSRFGNLNDNREPLANGWATRYQTGGAFSGGTRLAVWRDSRTNPTAVGTVDCGTSPFGRLEEGLVVAFSEKEDAIRLCERRGQVSPPQADVNCFPYEINWVSVGDGDLDPPWDNGWLYLNLDLDDLGTVGARRSQAWVETVMTALGLYQVGFPGIQLHSACDGLAPGVNGTIPAED